MVCHYRMMKGDGKERRIIKNDTLAVLHLFERDRNVLACIYFLLFINFNVTYPTPHSEGITFI